MIHKYKAYGIIAALPILMLLFGCKSSTTPQVSKLTGRVILQNDTSNSSKDPLDYSGVMIALYSPAVLDTTIVRLNQIHPNIGIQISQETDFDHRLQAPIATTLSQADGTFSFTDIAIGTYNIVYLKDGWDLKYKYNVSVSQSDMALPDTVSLYPVRVLPSFVSVPYTFEADRSYRVLESTTFTQAVTINPEAKIYFDPVASIKFYDTVTTPYIPNKYWRMNSSYNMYESTQTTMDVEKYFDNVSLYGSQGIVANGLIKHLREGIAFINNNGHLQNIDIQFFKSGFTFNNVGGVVEHCSLRSGIQKGIQGLSTSHSLTVSNCLVYKNYDGIIAYTAGGFAVEDSYLIRNEYAIRPQFCSGTISHNNFHNNTFDIYQTNAETSINLNNFYFSSYSCIRPSYYSILRSNNFIKPNYYFITIRGDTGSPTFVSADLDAKYNYWGVADIGTYILDKYDNDQYPTSPCPHEVLYMPKTNSRILDAGIRAIN